MGISLWLNSVGEYAACDGPWTDERGKVRHRIPEGGWIVKDDPLHQRFINRQSAAASVVNKALPDDLISYLLERGGEERTVLSYPDVIEQIKSDGWSVVMAEKPR